MGGKGGVVTEKMKLMMALITLQLCFAGFHIVSRVALNIGVSKVVYPVYRNILALLLISPFAYFLEKNERPPLTFSLLVQFFLLALIGITANQGFYLLGLYYASPTFASAMQNSVPAITFIMACALRLEEINLARRDGVAKVLGTVVSIGGATIITLYRGIPIFHKSLGSEETYLHESKSQNWTFGCLYLLGHCLSWAGWMVLQAPVLKKYPAKLTLTSFTCLFGLIQFLVIALFVETDINNWVIVSWEELLTILYAGIVASGIVVYLQTWCIHKGGPVFVAVFQPLQTLLVAAMAFLLLGDQLYSGRIVGAVFIMLGLYLVLWGKTEERRTMRNQEDESLTKHLLGDETTGEAEENNESAV
ncbi:PREDICTED: WAT1-related protein At3g18200 [Tarenaya hassleriana]|uniref:WAT1-related protein At3g18200 n=1 Tax=Tarenaya hassleriana TaxID=28532 RepID=UPI00053C249C|nr:PREDICTED: WAT1-related protein At3g18200 [Tarenaya hassleriana]